jgi:hypothetical protein
LKLSEIKKSELKKIYTPICFFMKKNAAPVPEPVEGTQGWRNNPEKDPSAGSGSEFWRFGRLVSTKQGS